MSCDRNTVAACVFQGHDAAMQGHHACPLVQTLARRVRNLGIEDVPASLDRELNKYRAVARVLACPMFAAECAEGGVTTGSPRGVRFSPLPRLPVPLPR